MQEPLQLGGLALEHLAEEVVGDGALVAAHLRQPLVGRPALCRLRRQIEAGRPPFGSLQQRDDRCLGPRLLNLTVGRAVTLPDPVQPQQREGLVTVEGELLEAHFQELAPRSQPAERQRRVAPRRHHQLRALGQVLEYEPDGRPCLVVLHELGVVQHEHERRRAGHRSRESGQDPIDERRATQLQQLEDSGSTSSSRSSATARQRSSTRGSLSPPSSRSQIVGRLSACSHCVSVTVLPEPAGADSSTSGSVEVNSVLTTALRATSSTCGRGGRSFEGGQRSGELSPRPELPALDAASARRESLTPALASSGFVTMPPTVVAACFHDNERPGDGTVRAR